MVENSKRTEVFWNNALIGHLTNTQMDMWYLEGEWFPIECKETREFIKILEGKSASDWFQGKMKEEDFIWVGFNENKPTGWIVLECDDKTLFLRMVSSVNPPEEW